MSAESPSPADGLTESQRLAKELQKIDPNFDLESDRARAAKIVADHDADITDPFARFNLNLPGANGPSNPEVQFSPDLPPFPTPELSGSISPEQIIEIESGQRINYVTINWEKFTASTSKRALLYLPPYGNYVGKEGVQYRASEIARLCDAPVIAMDHPGTGKSGKLTEEQRRGLQTSEGYTTVARAELEALQKLGVEELDLAGTSMGAFGVTAVAELAGEYDITIRNVVVAEAVGLEDRSKLKLLKDFQSEAKYIPLYQSTPYDPKMRIRNGLTAPGWRAARNMAKEYKDMSRPDSLRYIAAMATSETASRLERALRNNPAMELTMIHGTISNVSKNEANIATATRLKKTFGSRVKETILPGEPHPAVESATRFAEMVGLIMRSSK